MRIAIIGGGKMVTQMVKGWKNSGLELSAFGLWLRNKEKQQHFVEKHGVTSIETLEELKDYDGIMLGIVPEAFVEIAGQLHHYLVEDHLIMSIAGGVSIQDIDDMFDHHQKIVRMMPNTPVAVNAGVIAMSHNDYVSREEIQELTEIMQRLGTVKWIDESLMHIMPAIAASSPTFVYMMIEAMADNAVAAGLGRETAYQLASQMVIGAGKMVLESGKHPAVLKDQVTSPGGSTIQGVKKLEEKGFRDAISKAMDEITKYN
ncbi:pyrroline-5-carboxylate reductase [Macrococcus equipercicus]|uniref:Pyrroline-5-carboxylate reductase n=1 Tax=Macrococcus equipercicus TaxID=69967 RepID=A0A9Q9F3G8_9STAP|nr:pyrroline-5-carboxylate reductase [Macrococcus equipercicus]KAA1039663.1 pyrroline-5-carboxylate reductase [Macrococcus equipercicus]UTH13994.1 pyrroline-5-carboxylate reductase [Macrococcus equipercicus]